MATGTNKITLRLSIGFGSLLLLMATMIAAGYTHMTEVGKSHRRLVETNWVNADATHTIAATTSANAREAMELIIAPEKERYSEIAVRILANKRAVDDALNTLDRLLYTSEGKALLEQIRQARIRYITAVEDVGRLNADGKRDEATTLMLNTALPALTALQLSLRRLSALQDKVADANGSDVRREIESAHRWMAALGTLALVFGIGCAYWIRRALVCPFACCER